MCSQKNRLIEAILMSTHNIPIQNSMKEKHLKLYQTCSCWIFSKALKNEFEKAVVNKSFSVRAIGGLLYLQIILSQKVI